MQVNKYDFCGCKIELICEEPIAEESVFHLFRSDFRTADYSLKIIRTKDLPPESGTAVQISERRKVDGAKKLYTAYFSGGENKYIDYGCKIGDSELYICYPDKIREVTVFDCIDLPSLLLQKGIGLLHCSFIEYRGGAYLFAGDKEVGKSTQAALWKKHRNAETVNGDRAGIVCENGVFFACGVPFCGTSKICNNKKIPLKAIICLSKGNCNSLERLSPLSAFLEILGKFTYNSSDKISAEAATSLARSISENLPVYSYSCLKDGSAVDFLESKIIP